jgi:hypothetical protein
MHRSILIVAAILASLLVMGQLVTRLWMAEAQAFKVPSYTFRVPPFHEPSGVSVLVALACITALGRELKARVPPLNAAFAGAVIVLLAWLPIPVAYYILHMEPWSPTFQFLSNPGHYAFAYALIVTFASALLLRSLGLGPRILHSLAFASFLLVIALGLMVSLYPIFCIPTTIFWRRAW